MQTKRAALPASATLEEILRTLVREAAEPGQHLYPIVDDERQIKGVITRRELRHTAESSIADASLGNTLRQPVVAYADESLRVVVFRMAETGFTRLPVVDPERGQLAGIISLNDLLMARVRSLNEERVRERVLQVRFPFRRAKHGDNQGAFHNPLLLGNPLTYVSLRVCRNR